MITAVFMLGISILVQANPPSAGMILGLNGKVTVQRGTTQSSARVAEMLRNGDRIRVESGGATFVFCPTSERLVLGAGTTVELQANAIRVVGGTAPTRTASKCVLPQVALGEESLQRVGGIRARGNPPVALFTGGPITTSRPVFEWAQVDGSPTYSVVLKNANGIMVWQQQTSATKLAYPATMAALAAGPYTWELRAEAGGKLVGEQTADFAVKPPAAVSVDAGDDPAGRLLQAMALENAGYLAEAAAYFRELQKSDASDQRITRHLAWLYWNAGLRAAADVQLQKLPR